jgi:hypothetical protein
MNDNLTTNAFNEAESSAFRSTLIELGFKTLLELRIIWIILIFL